MPIYAYRCATCGHAQDVLQKLSDPLLTVCPACGAATYAKQLTAAGFQLKGSGWYVTDFREGNNKKAPPEGADVKPADGAPAADVKPADKPADKPAERGPEKGAPKPADGAAAKAPSAPSAPAATPPAPASGS